MVRKTGPRKSPRLPLALLIPGLLAVPGVYVALIAAFAANVAIGGGIIWASYLAFTSIIAPGEYHWGSIKLGVLLGGAMISAGIGILIGVAAAMRGVFSAFRVQSPFVPAIPLPLEHLPRLRELILDVCKDLKTKPPRNTLLCLEPEFFVTSQRINHLAEHASGRTLVLGAPMLSSLSVDEIRAIIAHEMAHFSGRDTLYSLYVLPVYTSTLASMKRIDESFYSEKVDHDWWTLLPIHVAYLILSTYLFGFHLLNMAISRRREIRADFLACLIAGRERFQNALNKSYQCESDFQQFISDEYPALKREKRAAMNFFEDFRNFLAVREKKPSRPRQPGIQEKASRFDSHPILVKRLSVLPEIPSLPDEGESARTLLPHPEQYEMALTKHLNFARQGASYW